MKSLFLQKRILFPADVGVKIRTLNVIRHLAKWQEITYLCNVQDEDQPYLEQMRELGVRLETIPWKETPRGTLRFYGELAANLFSRYPFNVNKDYDQRIRGRAKTLLAAEHYDLVICDFVQMARNVIGLEAPAKLLFQHNVEAQIFKRHSENDPGWLRRQYMKLQWQKMRKFEHEAGADFDCVIAVSERDRKTFESNYGWRHVRVIDTAVDLEHFQPLPRTKPPGRVVFVGSLDWLCRMRMA